MKVMSASFQLEQKTTLLFCIIDQTQFSGYLFQSADPLTYAALPSPVWQWAEQSGLPLQMKLRIFATIYKKTVLSAPFTVYTDRIAAC